MRENLLEETESDCRRDLISSDDMIIDTWSRKFAIGSDTDSRKRHKKHKKKHKKSLKRKHKKMTEL